MRRAKVVSRRSQFKACKNCGALVPRDTKICPVCRSTQFTDNWDGMIIIIDPKESIASSMAGRDKPGMYAIRVAGKK